jgi:hypothetical protein
MHDPAASSTPASAATIAAAWGAPLALAGCDHCDWAALLPPGLPERMCPNCFQPALSERAEIGYGQAPELAIPFIAKQEQLEQGLRKFRDSIPFAPADLQPSRLMQRLRRVYVPMWLVDGGVAGGWQAELGYNYDVVSFQDRFDDQAGWQSHEITETRVRWEPRAGRLSRAYQNIPAPAMEGFERWREQLGEYNLRAAQPYRAELLDGALVRLPSRPPADAWYEAARGFRDAAADECRQAGGADHIREFGWSPQFAQLHWTQLLLPAYTSYYLDDNQAVRRVLIHGQTGRAGGPRRASIRRAWRRALLVLAMTLVLLGVAALSARYWIDFSQDLETLLFVAFIVALVVGRLAITPFVKVSTFNRQQHPEQEIG